MPDDFIDGIRKDDAIKAARQRAIDPPQRRSTPRTATNSAAKGGYAQGALRKACEAIENATKRNNTTNTELFNLGQLIAAGELDEQTVRLEIGNAARRSGLPDREIRLLLRDDETGGISRGIRSGPRDMEKVAAQRIPAETKRTKKTDTVDDEPEPREIRVRSLATVKTRVPLWIWDWEGVGRMQLGTLCMFAGKPAAGKSTATRWFAAEISNGTLPGIWYGTPLKVAVYSPEEQLDDTIAPSFQAVGANMRNVIALSAFENGQEDGILSVRDEARLTDTLIDNNIRALFVDPLMQTFDSKIMDPHKNTDVRRHLMPYVRIAKAINGICVGVTHLRKGNITDVMTGINGSSAFGELPRSIFGFASVGDGTNVMEQVKNSAGPTGLKLEYRLPIERGLADDGQYYELPRFEIKGETELSIIDLGGERSDEDATTSAADVLWLRNYLQIEQPAPSKRLKDDAIKSADISVTRLHKARKKLRVQIINTPTPDAPHTTAWCLPGFRSDDRA
jgi:hypothetical protein